MVLVPLASWPLECSNGHQVLEGTLPHTNGSEHHTLPKRKESSRKSLCASMLVGTFFGIVLKGKNHAFWVSPSLSSTQMCPFKSWSVETVAAELEVSTNGGACPCQNGGNRPLQFELVSRWVGSMLLSEEGGAWQN